MSMTDSVPVFAEGTYEEQIQELVNYIVRNRSDEERASFIRPFQDALKTEEGKKPLDEDEDRRRKVFSMVLAEVKSLGEGSEKEIEGFFNLLWAHLFTLYPGTAPETSRFLTDLLQIFSSSPSENAFVKYRILSSLFNAIPRKSPLRLVVYKTLLYIAVANDQLEVLQISQANVEEWLKEWEVSFEERSAFLKTITDAHVKCGLLDTSYKYTLLYLRSLPTSSPISRNAAIDAISLALQLPSVLEFDSLFKLEAIVAAKNHELYTLLHVFLNEGLAEFRSWEGRNPLVFENYGLDRKRLERKIRLLTLASLGFKHIGQDLPYTSIANALEVELDEVENWVIDVIRTGLLSGKLSQTTQTLHVTRSTARTFEREQWEALEKRLETWKGGLAGVLEVVSAARKRGGNIASTEVASAQTAVAVA